MVYQGKVPDAAKAEFFARSKAHIDVVASLIYDVLPGHLPESGFVGGERPGEADFHVGAWLARIAAASGAQRSEEGLQAFEKAFGKKVSERLASYWNAWVDRASWKEVYAAGLH